MKRRRVKITGIGPVTPAGIGREAFWKGILEPVSRVREFAKFGEEFGPFAAAQIERFNFSKYVDRTLVPKGSARQTLFAISGAALAVEDAGITRAELAKASTAVVTGSSIMDFASTLSSIDAVRQRGVGSAQPRSLYVIGVGSVASAINSALELNARTSAFSNQCGSGLDAVAYAADLVATGQVDMAICGGTEAPLNRFPMVELRAAELTPATNEQAGGLARPFDLWRTTGVVAEGCCMFVLESEFSPRPGYSFVAGCGFASDATDVLCGGMVGAGKAALAEARIRPSDIDVINAWGPGHKLVDRGEADAMVKLFGPELGEIAVVSIKGAVGTPLGAAPAMQIATAALGQKYGIVAPTVNWEYPDPGCALNLSRRMRAIPHRWTLINTHGLGAVNSSMILERC
jgi:3-oxoacyl-[acyl-carrier-protein] synthase II